MAKLEICRNFIVMLCLFALVESFRLSTTASLRRNPTYKLSMALTPELQAKIGSANLDWPNLGFEYRQTNTFVMGKYKNGAWEPLESAVDPMIKVHIGATALHYGQACFEGLKAFHCKDGKVRIFRPTENARRISKSAQRICMPAMSEDYFLTAVKKAVSENVSFLPPYGTGGSMYIRPVLFGTGPRVGLQPSDEYTLVVMVMPAADYYRGGWKPVTAVVVEDYDRAAPRGVGNVKVGGNYAADILPNTQAKKEGYPIALYLDATTHSKVEEFSTSNFIAIDSEGRFVTPQSEAILESITNKSLMEIATREGIEVQRREVGIKEITNFREVGACGTAVVLTPVNRVVYQSQVIEIGEKGGEGESLLRKLYTRIRNIQQGEEEDALNWMVEL